MLVLAVVVISGDEASLPTSAISGLPLIKKVLSKSLSVKIPNGSPSRVTMTLPMRFSPMSLAILFTGVFSSAVTISLVMKSSTLASVSGTSGKLLIRSEAVMTPTSLPLSNTPSLLFLCIIIWAASFILAAGPMVVSG